MHRVVRASRHAGLHFLEREGLQAMVGSEDHEADEAAAPAQSATAAGSPSADLCVVSLSVDGLGTYGESPATRMEALLTLLLRAAPDVLLLQEVVAEMYAVVRRRLPEWQIHRRHQLSEIYFNATATRNAPASTHDKTASDAFPT